MSGRTNTIAAVATVAIAVAAFLSPMTAASAASQDLDFTNSAGSVTMGGLPSLPIPAGSTSVTGTWDDATGAFTGHAEFNPITIPATPPLLPEVVITFGGPPGNVVGTIDPTTGAVALTASMQLTVANPSLAASCSSPVFDVSFVDSSPFAPLPFDPQADYAMSVSGTFTVPEFQETDCALATVLNGALGLPVGGAATLDLVHATTTPTTPTTAPPADDCAVRSCDAATTSPRFTG